MFFIDISLFYCRYINQPALCRLYIVCSVQNLTLKLKHVIAILIVCVAVPLLVTLPRVFHPLEDTFGCSYVTPTGQLIWREFIGSAVIILLIIVIYPITYIRIRLRQVATVAPELGQSALSMMSTLHCFNFTTF